MKHTVSIQKIAKWGRRQEGFVGWRIKDQEEIQNILLLWPMVIMFELCHFNLGSCTSYLKFQQPVPWTQPSIFAALIALLHPVRFPLALGIKITSTIFIRTSTFFHLRKMRPVEPWIFVTTDCLPSLQLPRKGCFHIQEYWRVIWTVDTVFTFHLPSAS